MNALAIVRDCDVPVLFGHFPSVQHLAERGLSHRGCSQVSEEGIVVVLCAA